MTFDWHIDLGALGEHMIECTVVNDRLVTALWYGPDQVANVTHWILKNEYELAEILERAEKLADIPKDPFALAKAAYVY